MIRHLTVDQDTFPPPRCPSLDRGVPRTIGLMPLTCVLSVCLVSTHNNSLQVDPDVCGLVQYEGASMICFS